MNYFNTMGSTDYENDKKMKKELYVKFHCKLLKLK